MDRKKLIRQLANYMKDEFERRNIVIVRDEFFVYGGLEKTLEQGIETFELTEDCTIQINQKN